MKRIIKAIFLLLRFMVRFSKCLRLYYWCDFKLYELREIYVMPRYYYHWLYHICMRLVAFKKFRRIADRVIHTIPYFIRFEEA